MVALGGPFGGSSAAQTYSQGLLAFDDPQVTVAVCLAAQWGLKRVSAERSPAAPLRSRR